MNTLDGLSIWLGNNPFSRGSFLGDIHILQDPSTSPQIQMPAGQFPDFWQVNEAVRASYYKLATIRYLIGTLRNDPKHLLWLQSRKVAVFLTCQDSWRTDDRWRGIPLYDRMASYYVLLLLCSYALMFSFRSYLDSDFMPFLLMFVSGFLVSFIVFPDGRYRMPYEIGLIPPAVDFADSCLSKIRKSSALRLGR